MNNCRCMYGTKPVVGSRGISNCFLFVGTWQPKKHTLLIQMTWPADSSVSSMLHYHHPAAIALDLATSKVSKINRSICSCECFPIKQWLQIQTKHQRNRFSNHINVISYQTTVISPNKTSKKLYLKSLRCNIHFRT